MSAFDLSIVLTILVAALLTYSLRVGGLLISQKLPRNGPFKRFMEALPGAILLSIIAPGIVAIGPWGWVAVASTAVCAHRTGNALLSMLAGMAVIIVQRHFMP